MKTVILTRVFEGLAAVKLSLPVLTTYFDRGRDSNTKLSTCEANFLTECPTAADFARDKFIGVDF